LSVLYAGHGKTPKDAASVRATHPIPAACGIYYFEVKIVSKGRDGYMGIGLSAQGVNMNRLPGWDKHSYGYHGDDGHSFCSSGTGQPYGPTFTTGDVIGCCVNLINNTCFYTKNGHSLGIAFTDLPGDTQINRQQRWRLICILGSKRWSEAKRTRSLPSSEASWHRDQRSQEASRPWDQRSHEASRPPDGRSCEASRPRDQQNSKA
ncbi:Ran-binding protein 9, partial [Myotis davidii]